MRRLGLWCCLGLAVAGCAGRRTPVTGPRAATLPATRPADDPALLSLDQIRPVPVLPSPAATTRPADPPLESLHLYAQARSAQLSGDRNAATVLLRQALDKDPDSFELNYALAISYMGSGLGNGAAVGRLEKALQIEPDHLEAQFQLGRQYLVRGEIDKAIDRFRLALQTTGYRDHPETGALVNLFLARSLQQKGYDTAALEQYDVLLSRLDGRMNIRSSAEVYYFFARPDAIYLHIGELSEKVGRLDQAMHCYSKAVARDPGSFAYQSHIVNLLARQQKFDQAKQLAASLVSQHRASMDSLDLLKQVYRQAGQEASLVDELRRIHNRRPDDRAMVLALADLLKTMHRNGEAEDLLREAMKQGGPDVMVVSQLLDLALARNDGTGAARLLIESMAQQPEAVEDYEEMWTRLTAKAGSRLHFTALQQLQVAPKAAASKLYWVARVAQTLGRASVARSSIQQAVAIRPMFAPAYREMLEQILVQDSPKQEKSAAARKLIADARAQGQKALAEELNGLLLLNEEKPQEAAAAFAKAIEAGQNSPTVSFARAAALFKAGQVTDGESALWEIVHQWPTYDRAYVALYSLYEKAVAQRAEAVLQVWLSADPMSVNARLLRARFWADHGRRDEAERALLDLLKENPDAAGVVAELRTFYGAGQQDVFLAKLEEEQVREPESLLIAEELVTQYSKLKRAPEALRAVERFRSAVVSDTEQLYYASQLYTRLGKNRESEDVLRQILRLDPQNASANNDLGYFLADEGRSLTEAEAMLRTAVGAEPDNAAYLDSLGWLLYKRGKFSEAATYLAEANRLMEPPDPVVLDHLGDVWYRLGRAADAARVWQQALDRLSQIKREREDLTKLKLPLKQKLEQHKGGRSVDVAPIAEDKAQAKN